MGRRLRVMWKSTWESLWFIPTVMTLLAIILALGMVRLDRMLGLDERDAFWWAFEGGSESAFRVLTAIAGTMVSVIGVVFSVTVVSLQLASSQFSPLVLRTFTSDRSNQLVFGIFFATFTYTLLVIRAVRESTDETEAFAAPVSATFAIFLALVSVASLIYFINHIARSIQAPVVVDRATRDAHDMIDTLYPGDIGEPASDHGRERVASLSGEPGEVYANDAGYIETIEEDTIFGLADDRSLVVRIEPHPGTFVVPGMLLAHVWPSEDLDDHVTDTIRKSLLLNLEPTTQSDIGFGVRQLADIATKALSPGINDVATAKICLDRLSELLVRLATHEGVVSVRAAGDGNERVLLLLEGPAFDELVNAGFSPIRTFGADNPDIASYLMEKLGLVSSLAAEANREPLREQADLVLRSAREHISVEPELERVERAGAWLTEG